MGEVLHLLKMKVETLGLGGKLGHVGLMTSGMGGDEVRYELLFQVMGGIYTVKKRENS